MPQRPPASKTAPAEVLAQLNQGYNGYTDPRITKPTMWAPGTVNCYSGAFGYIQRSRFADILSSPPAATPAAPFATLKYFALPGLSAYLLADLAGKLFSYDTGANYTQTQRFNPYVDPAGSGSSLLNGPWSREVLQNIVYEMNGQVKMAGRLANAATIEGWGLDAPDASPQVVVSAGSSQTITNIQRSNSIVTVTLGAALTVPGGNGIGFINVTITVGDTSFNGTFIVQTGQGTATLTWNQPGQNTALLTPTGTVDVNITKSVGRSYAWAWENVNKSHVSAPSPSTQFIQYTAQNGAINLIEPGTVTTTASPIVNGVGTFFTAAWVGRHLFVNSAVTGGDAGRIVSVQSATQLTLAANAQVIVSAAQFQVFDPSATHVRLYQTADGQATYFRVQRNAFTPSSLGLFFTGLSFFDNGNAEPPNFPFTTETSQINNVPPPIGSFVNEYQGRLCVYGVPGAPQSFFYSNQETTLIGMPQESFAPLNQITLPIANGKMNGMLEFPGSAIIWSDKQDMFRLSGLLSDNTLSTAAQQGASISRLPYNLGSAGPYAMDITPLGGIWLTSNLEVWLFTDRYAPRNIGRPVQDILSTIAPAQLGLARGKYYHTSTRNWMVFAVPAFGANYNNTLLVLDLDLLASNGSPSYFTFDMATNHPAWWVIQPGPLVNVNTITPRCDSLETVYEQSGQVRLLTGCVDTSTGGSTSGKSLIQDVDFQTGLFAGGGEIPVPGAKVILHPWGNDTPFLVKRPTWFRFETNRPPPTLGPEGWSFQALGIDYDFYTFDSPLSLTLTPGVNDVATLCGNPNLAGGESFRFSPALFRIGGVNFVAGRRIKFVINFPSLTGVNYQISHVQIGFSAKPPG